MRTPTPTSHSRKTLAVIVFLGLTVVYFMSGHHVQAAPIADVQSRLAYTASLVKSYSATFSSPVTGGDLIVVATSSWNTSNNASITSVTDNKGNVYSKVLENISTSGEPLAIWYAKNVNGGSSFIVTASTNNNSKITLAIHEYSGIDKMAPLDVSANASGTGTNAASGYTALTSVSSELVFGAFNFMDDLTSVSGSAGAGFTLRQSQTNNHKYEAIYTEDQFASSTGKYQSTLTYGRSVTWRGAVVTFKSASIVTPTPTPSSISTTTATLTPLPTLTPTATSLPSSTPTPTSIVNLTFTPTVTPTLTSTSTAVPSSTPTPTPGSSVTPTPTPTQNVPLEFFKLGPGYTDVIPHQIVRTSQDKVYLFAASGVSSSAIQVYWTNQPGVPSSKNDFSGSLTYTATINPISVEAAYDGGAIIHVLANLIDGTLYDYPFDLTTNTFKSPHLISSGDPVSTTLYPGTAGVSAMVSLDGALNVAYWTSGNHVTYASFTYDPVSDTLTPQATPFQVDSAGYASHPVLAVSPLDGSVTVAWLSEAVTPHQVLGRTKTAAGWGNLEQVSNPTVKVWTYVDPYGGVSVDQGPSLIITADGAKHLAYIEDTDSTGSYGRTHYVYYTSQTGWQDTRLNYYTHDPSLATNSSSEVYLFGHGMYLDSSPCSTVQVVCDLKKNPDGTWGAPQLFATPPSGETFDDSVSTKWSVVGWNRPDLIEVAFFSGQTANYWNMSLYYGTLGGNATSPTSTPTPVPTPTSTNSPTSTPTSMPTPTSTNSPSSTPTVAPSSTPTPVAIAYVQSNLSKNGGLVSSTTTQFTNPVATGDLIVVAVSSWNSSTSHVSSVTDNQGNVYTQVVEVIGAANEPLSIWYAKNVVGGSTLTVTVTVSAASSITTAIHEYHGLSGTAPLDLYADQTGSGTSASSGLTGVIHSSPELIFGAFNYDNPYTSNAFVPVAGFTSRQSLQDNYNYEALYTIDEVVNSVGQYAAAGTFGTTSSWRAVVVTFK